MLTVKQAAEKKGVSPSRITQLITAGVIKAEKFSGVWLIHEEDLEKAVWPTRKTPWWPSR